MLFRSVADCSSVWYSESEPEVESASTGAERQDVGRYSHITSPLLLVPHALYGSIGEPQSRQYALAESDSVESAEERNIRSIHHEISPFSISAKITNLCPGARHSFNKLDGDIPADPDSSILDNAPHSQSVYFITSPLRLSLPARPLDSGGRASLFRLGERSDYAPTHAR